jgi:hypothetical protein
VNVLLNLVDTTGWEIPYWFEIHGRLPGHLLARKDSWALGRNLSSEVRSLGLAP